MAVNLDLSKEQAALLLPLLQQISSKAQQTESAPTRLSSTSVAPALPIETHHGEFTVEQLLQKKKKNRKSTPAQTYLLVSIIYLNR